MSVHITKTYNIGGLIGLRQNAVRNAGETLEFKEMSLFKFPDQYDSDEELDVRMDGIISALCPDDIVIFQYPSGESPRYDSYLFKHIRMYRGTKIIVFVQGIASEIENSNYNTDEEIDLLNKADMFIFASEELRNYYAQKGIMQKPFLVQKVADYITDISLENHEKRNLYMLAENDNSQYQINGIQIETVRYDEYHVPEMLLRLSEGGFGLIPERDEQAIGLYMAAGIPVIVRKGLSCEKYVVENKVGFVVDNLEDVPAILKSLTEDNIWECYKNVAKIKRLFTNGVYTKKMLLETLIFVREN